MKQFLSAPSLLGLAFAGLGLLLSLGNAQASGRDVAQVYLQANGAEQRIEVDLIALPPGQSRQLFTDTGLPAIVSRDEQGLSIEVAGETHEVRMPKLMHLAADASAGDGEVRTLVIKRDASDDGAAHTDAKVRVIRLAGDGTVDTEDVDALVARALAEAEADGLDLSGPEGEGRTLRVVRRIDASPGN